MYYIKKVGLPPESKYIASQKQDCRRNQNILHKKDMIASKNKIYRIAQAGLWAEIQCIENN